MPAWNWTAFLAMLTIPSIVSWSSTAGSFCHLIRGRFRFAISIRGLRQVYVWFQSKHARCLAVRERTRHNTDPSTGAYRLTQLYLKQINHFAPRLPTIVVCIAISKPNFSKTRVDVTSTHYRARKLYRMSWITFFACLTTRIYLCKFIFSRI